MRGALGPHAVRQVPRTVLWATLGATGICKLLWGYARCSWATHRVTGGRHSTQANSSHAAVTQKVTQNARQASHTRIFWRSKWVGPETVDTAARLAPVMVNVVIAEHLPGACSDVLSVFFNPVGVLQYCDLRRSITSPWLAELIPALVAVSERWRPESGSFTLVIAAVPIGVTKRLPGAVGERRGQGDDVPADKLPPDPYHQRAPHPPEGLTAA